MVINCSLCQYQVPARTRTSTSAPFPEPPEKKPSISKITMAAWSGYASREYVGIILKSSVVDDIFLIVVFLTCQQSCNYTVTAIFGGVCRTSRWRKDINLWCTSLSRSAVFQSYRASLAGVDVNTVNWGENTWSINRMHGALALAWANIRAMFCSDSPTTLDLIWELWKKQREKKKKRQS